MTTRKHAFYGILALVSLLGLGITQSARASFITTILQVGTNVVATDSGTIDLFALTPNGTNFAGDTGITPNFARQLHFGPVDVYAGISGPTSYGIGMGAVADTSSGNGAGLLGFGTNSLLVPSGYMSGNFLSGTFAFNNQNFATLGITPGTYTWTWGTGDHADSLTIQIGPAGVPDAGSTLSLLGFASLGLVALRRKLRC